MNTYLVFSVLQETVPGALREIGKDVQQVVTNTDSYKIFDLIPADGPTFWIAFIGMILSFLATLFGYLGYRYQKVTSDNTGHVSIEIQKSEFSDIIRHLYRNLICTLAFARKIKISDDATHLYPSEEHLRKLKLLPEDVHLEKFNDNISVYSKMHHFKLLVRNYHIEIDLTLEHMMNKHINQDIVKSDIHGLEFKPFYLIGNLIDVESVMNKVDRKYRDEDSEKLKQKAFAIILFNHILNVNSNKSAAFLGKWKDLYHYDADLLNEEAADEDGRTIYDCARSFKNCFLEKVDREYVMALIKNLCPDDKQSVVEQFMNGKGIFETLEGMDGIDTYREALKSETLNIKELLSFAISIDRAIEISKINMVELIS